MKAEIISIGTELLLGEIVDTNASFLAGQLPALGIDLYWVSEVGDNQERLVEVLKRAWSRSDIILTSGGLGPTADDITREAIAELLREKMAVDAALENEVREFFTRRNINMPQSNLKQATLIPSATSMHNLVGTAPGWRVEKDKHIIFAMPGPPMELKQMWQKEVLPVLHRFSDAIIVFRTFKIAGVSEARAGEMVELLFSSNNPTLGIYAKPDGIHLRLGAKAATEEKAWALLQPAEATVREIMGDHIWGVDDETLEEIAGRKLMGAALTLAIVDASTGGLLTDTLTSVPEARDYFKGGLIAYCGTNSNSADRQTIIPVYGPNSAETAQAMAETARRYFGADVGLGISSENDIEQPGKSSGNMIYIAISTTRGTETIGNNFTGNYLQKKRRVTTLALFELNKTLSKLVDK